MENYVPLFIHLISILSHQFIQSMLPKQIKQFVVQNFGNLFIKMGTQQNNMLLKVFWRIQFNSFEYFCSKIIFVHIHFRALLQIRFGPQIRRHFVPID
jgi:hypothetical protein